MLDCCDYCSDWASLIIEPAPSPVLAPGLFRLTSLGRESPPFHGFPFAQQHVFRVRARVSMGVSSVLIVHRSRPTSIFPKDCNRGSNTSGVASSTDEPPIQGVPCCEGVEDRSGHFQTRPPMPCPAPPQNNVDRLILKPRTSADTQQYHTLTQLHGTAPPRQLPGAERTINSIYWTQDPEQHLFLVMLQRRQIAGARRLSMTGFGSSRGPHNCLFPGGLRGAELTPRILHYFCMDPMKTLRRDQLCTTNSVPLVQTTGLCRVSHITFFPPDRQWCPDLDARVLLGHECKTGER